MRYTLEENCLEVFLSYIAAKGHSLKKRESYLVSRISKKDFGALKRIGYTRY